MSNYQRKRLWVHGPFQSRLLLRLVAYLGLFVAVVLHVGFFCELVPRLGAGGALQDGVGSYYLHFLGRQKHFLLALLLVLPCLLYDLLQFSHRLAGPLYRCQRVLAEMAAGRPVAPFAPRKDDHMGEFFAAFNALIEEWNARLAAENGRPGEGEAGTGRGAAGARRLNAGAGAAPPPASAGAEFFL